MNKIRRFLVLALLFCLLNTSVAEAKRQAPQLRNIDVTVSNQQGDESTYKSWQRIPFAKKATVTVSIYFTEAEIVALGGDPAIICTERPVMMAVGRKSTMQFWIGGSKNNSHYYYAGFNAEALQDIRINHFAVQYTDKDGHNHSLDWSMVCNPDHDNDKFCTLPSFGKGAKLKITFKIRAQVATRHN